MEVDGVAVQDETRLTQMRFDAAVKVIKSLPPNGSFQPSNDMMLKFYSYYKQATVGVCNIPRPGFWDAVGKAKWDAWNSLGEMPKEEAMAAYVNEMKLILEGMPMTSEVEDFLRVIGPFYELVEEKKKISQVSDLSTGFGTALNSVTSRSAAKSIIKMMEMNGTLEAHPTGRKAKEVGESAGEEEEGEEEGETREVCKAASQPKKKDSARRHKTPLTNGKVANGVAHLTNGNHSRAALNSDHSQEDETLLNGHHADPTVDALGPSHLASDSDSEVYCDSVDQLGQEENSEHNHSLEDLEEVGDHIQPPVEELHAVQELQEDHHTPPHVIKCGGEDGENGGAMSQRGRLTTDASNSSLVRRGRGSKSPRLGSANMVPVHGAGDGDGDRWGRAGTPSGSLNEQIVVALARLQDDMQSVLERLHTLEALTASQARSVSLSPTYALPPVSKRSQKPSWWPFDISPTSLAFAVIWPFVVQWLISLYVHRRRRRRN